jgi:hypothetical protein
MPRLAPSLAVALLLLGAACATVPDDQLAGTFVVRTAMQQRLNPAVLSIEQVKRAATGAYGHIDTARLDASQWQQLATGAGQLASFGHDMALAREFIAAPPENAAVRSGEVPMDEVQDRIDSDPYLYRQLSADLAEHADKLVTAAGARDNAAAGKLLARTDSLCANCHARFWRPD